MGSRDRYTFLVTSWKSVIQKEKRFLKMTDPEKRVKYLQTINLIRDFYPKYIYRLGFRNKGPRTGWF